MLTACQNPYGCRKIAVKTVKAIDTLGRVQMEAEVCAYCVEKITVPDHCEKVVV